MLQQYGREATPDELAKAMEMPEDKIRKVLKIAKEPISMETPIGDDEDSHLGDFIEDGNASSPVDSATETGLMETVRDVLAGLTPREAKVLRMRFGIDMNTDHTLEEVGKQFDVIPRTHPPDRSQGAAQAAPSEPLRTAAFVPRRRVTLPSAQTPRNAGLLRFVAIARSKHQRHEGTPASRMQPLLLGTAPLASKRGDPAIGAGVPLHRKGRVSQRVALLAGLLPVGATPTGTLDRLRIKLAGTLAVRITRAGPPARQGRGDGVA
jgi:hypothetical protein